MFQEHRLLRVYFVVRVTFAKFDESQLTDFFDLSSPCCFSNF